ncbi:hypothetical protein C1645_877693 [Glomus cerebriforme]|uniref:DUF7431 domain-containing protein n=1 Tax=Glomus cerebriforme TaxID=658196 RepID=A0A397SZ15_9GLOM|nr:hypothetical protein C1645_877693 [Glomus cerebriforme]
MVVGYDIDFNIILPNMISVDVIREKYDSQSKIEFDSIPSQRKFSSMMTNGIPFFGIPVLDNLDPSNNSIVIGHNFDNTNVNVFSYCVKKKCYVKLPKFTFCTFIIPNCTSKSYRSLSFNSKIWKALRKNPFIGLDTSSINPSCISLYLSKNNNFKPIFLIQRIKQVKIKYVDCNCKKTCSICKDNIVSLSKNENNVECIFFDP